MKDDFFDHSECDHGPVQFWVDLSDGLRLDLLGVIRYLRREVNMLELKDWLATLHVLLEASALDMGEWLRKSFEDAVVAKETSNIDMRLYDLLRRQSE